MALKLFVSLVLAAHTASAFMLPQQHVQLRPDLSTQFRKASSPASRLMDAKLSKRAVSRAPISGTTGIRMQADDKSDMTQKSKKMMENVMEGEFGSRGEIYVAAQFFLIFLVLIAPVFGEALEEQSVLPGMLIALCGLGLCAAGALHLDDNLTPWPKPTFDNVLQKTGAFGLCRHPIYGGLLITCFGVSILTASYPRLLMSAILFATLNLKAEAEEKFLKDKHSDYSDYCEKVPSRFFPDPQEVLLLISKKLSN